MNGDFSRMTFDPAKHFLRVLMQQGRVQLDADWNEQTAILLHYVQTVVKDVIGPYAGPQGDDYGFAITDGGDGNFQIGKGRYYVDGVLVENRQAVWYRLDEERLPQPDFPAAPPLENGRHLVYLDVWERHMTHIQDDAIREQALGGADTTTRAKVVWQVKTLALSAYETLCNQGAARLDGELALSQACLSARAKQARTPTEPCLTLPEARYRGAENQLYRVEIHSPGDPQQNTPPTLKWSRDNGSMVFPIKTVDVDSSASMTTVELEHLGRDSDSSLAVGDWVETVNDDDTLRNQTRPLLQVFAVDRVEMKVTLTGNAEISADSATHPLLRRWDHKKNDKIDLIDGAVPIPEDATWIKLEDGIEVRLDIKGPVRSGDYWLIPARTASADVEWPKRIDDAGRFKKDDEGYFIPQALPPHGIVHRYAPLAIIDVDDDAVQISHDCRCSFAPLSDTCHYSYHGRLGIGADLLCLDE